MTPYSEKEIESWIKAIEEKIKVMFSSESSGHDIYHLKRVCNLALHLQEKEGGERIVVAAAALLHDIHRLMEKESGIFCPPIDSLPAVEKILNEIHFPKNLTPEVLHCIEHHEEYDFSENGKTAQDIETLILQDADNLDAIGAIGIGRTFAFNGAHAKPMWIPEKPFNRETFDESEKDVSTIHHFYSKLLKLKNNMNTETGKRLAEKRHEFMENFLEEFFKEWRGEN